MTTEDKLALAESAAREVWHKTQEKPAAPIAEQKKAWAAWHKAEVAMNKHYMQTLAANR